ncbi:hypothetical protein KUTeg_020546 [Tegillarca granosa]|uniref:F5/8 type C domain-containing protein n=1 Tax=Tegillarca granosa TaxID=220873 RepID=A0ABQ9EAQ7_TEGGR|nr:hypothetical protein KUTeg_020546 [Tegillarca granosa]
MARNIRGIPTLLCIFSIFFIVPKGAEKIEHDIHRKCFNGRINRNGECQCQPCWTGTNCDKPVNTHLPKFSEKLVKVQVERLEGDGETPIFTPSIANSDKTETCKDLDYCPCADVYFSIIAGNEDGLFTINPKTGSVYINKGSRLSKQEYKLKITVRGNSEEIGPTTFLEPIIVVSDHLFDDMERHHIEKRATAAPENVTFTLIKKHPFNDTTEMRVGSRVQFQLQISFPVTTTDILVELFTPDNDTTIMILCDVKVSWTGSSLSMTGTTTPVMDAKTPGSKLYDRAIINLGNVTNSGCTQIEDCSMYIDYEAIMIDNSNIVNGSIYWVSAGAEYNNEEEIWVGQASFVAMADDQSVPTSPTFNFTGPASMAIGSAAVFQVDMYLPKPSTALNFDAFAPLNTSSVMTICSAKLMHISENFLCGFDHGAVTNTFYNSEGGSGNGIAHLNIGTVVNKRSREADNNAANNLITVQFAAQMFEDASFVGQSYSVGAAFELGSDQIWAGQTEVTAAAAIDSSSMTTPTMTYSMDDTNVQIGQPKIFQLILTVPSATTSSYSLEVKTPFSTTAIFQLCSVSILTIGGNMPCLTKDDKIPVYTSQDIQMSIPDTGVLNIGPVSNLGMDSNSTADYITFNIVVIPLNHTSATPGSQHKVTATLTYGGGRTLAVDQTFDIAGSAAVPVDTSASPSFNMSYAIGNENVNVGTATKVYLDVTTNRSVTYPMMDIEFIMPVGNFSAKFSVCRARMISAGKNLPCVTPEWINSKITYASKFNVTKYDRALISLNAVCNFEVDSSEAEDQMRFEVDLLVENHEDLLHGTKDWVSAGNMYYDTKIWIGQLALFAQRSGPITPTTTPHITFIQNTTLAQIPLGYPVVYSILIKLAPGESADMKIIATSSQDGLYVCGLRVFFVGDNYPCLDNSTVATFTEFPTGGNQAGTLNMSIVTNTGSDAMTSNSYVDSNTILVQLIMKLSDTATNGASYSFDVDAYYTTTSKTSFTSNTVTATTDSSAVNGNVTDSGNYTLTIGDMTGNNESEDTSLYFGESKRFIVKMVLPEDVTQKVSVKFLTPTTNIGLMEICDAAVVHVGDNFPCLDKKTIDATFTSRTSSLYKDIGTLNLGFIRSTPLKPGDDAANTIVVEAVAKLLPHTSLSAGSIVPFHAVVNVNDMELWVAQMDLTVSANFNETWSDPALNNATLLKVNLTEGSIPMKVGEIITIPVILNIPAMSTSKVLFDIDIPMNNTATAIVKDIRLNSTGRNIGCLYENLAIPIKFTASFNSSTGTCEMNKATFDLGIVTNAGLMYRKDVYQDGDDSILLDVDIQLVDNELAEHLAEFWMSFGSTQGKYVVIYDRKFTVVRDGTEKPIIDITAVVNATYSTSVSVIVDVIMQHSNTSTARGLNTSALFYLPTYMVFKQITAQNITPSSVTTEESIVNIQFAEFLMCDIAAISLELEPNNSIAVTEDINTDKTLMAFEVGTNMQSRIGSSYAVNEYFSSDLKYINFTTSVTKAQDCSKNLGMESGAIVDCQITSSPESSLQNPAPQGRLRLNSAWAPFIRGSKYSPFRYFQVYFGNITAVNKVIVEQGTGFSNHPTSLRFEYSNDNLGWQVGETVSISAPFSETTIELQQVVESRYIRIYIVSDDTTPGAVPNIGLKFEFYGCHVSADVLSDVCSSTTTTTTPVDFYSRTFIEANGFVLVCDANPNNEMQQQCYRSSDGSTWKIVDSTVGSLLGFESLEKRHFAYARDKQTRIMSLDNGLTWETVPDDYYHDNRFKSTFTYAKEVPWVATNLNGATPHSNYQTANYGATFDGLMKLDSGGSWTRVVQWDSCC